MPGQQALIELPAPSSAGKLQETIGGLLRKQPFIITDQVFVAGDIIICHKPMLTFD